MVELNGLNWLNRIQLQNVETGNRPDDEGDLDESLDVGGDHLKHDDIPGVYMNPKHEDRASSFFAQPGVLAGKVFLLLSYIRLYHFNSLKFVTEDVIRNLEEGLFLMLSLLIIKFNSWFKFNEKKQDLFTTLL